ncbi:hypothetical protein, conserved [Eimeria brunetti]|uniref:Transmembrane protein n=1 Tax=Eimeria brunetti TaxID=51314 RepID=U6LG03_9EIME|nr:hypothetical protein, conserved [Eimeria brunetti]
MGSSWCYSSRAGRQLRPIQQLLVVLLMCVAAATAASSESAAAAVSRRGHAGDSGTGGSNEGGNWNLLELSEQINLAAQSLKPNAEPTVFPPPSQQEELHWDSRMDVVMLCLSLVDTHFKTHLPLLRQTVPDASSKMGMREDDVLATLMHQMWAGCYSNALSLPASVPASVLSSREAEALLKPHKSPMRFPAQTLVDIDRLVKEFADGRSPSDWHTTDWRDTWWFCILSVLCIFCFLFLGGRKAARAYRKKHKGKVGVRERAPLTSPKYL